MRISMITNTYLPHVGGVALSVDSFTREYRKLGHDVLVIAPTFEGLPEEEDGVVRVPAIQEFNGSDFSVRLPIPLYLNQALDRFQPEIVHSHHPFLMGDTAARISASRSVPLVFTHHTRHEVYTHYVPIGLESLKTFVIEMATGYANLCDRVIAPSQSMSDLLQNRGVTTPIEPIPTGVDPHVFKDGAGDEFRKERGIPVDAFVVGHLGRLAPEKNLEFLMNATLDFLDRFPKAWLIVAGDGSSKTYLEEIVKARGLHPRVLFPGTVQGQEKVDCYHAMDVFAFSSHSETQGMVLAEAMACGVPVIGIDAPGVREVVRDRENGRLLPEDNAGDFLSALAWIAECDLGNTTVSFRERDENRQ